MTYAFRHGRVARRGAFALLFAWLLAYEVHVIAVPHAGTHGVFDKQTHLGVLMAAAALTLLRAAVRCEERLAWALIGSGVLAWAAGEIYYTQVIWNLKVIPIPSWADAGYLAFPVFTFSGLCLLARGRVRSIAGTMWADGLAAGMAVGAMSAAFVLDEVLKHTTGHSLSVITNLAYPVTDLVMLGACVTVIALRGWRLDRTFTLLAAGVTVFWIADSLYLVETARGTYTPGGVFDPGWWVGLTLIAVAAWQPSVATDAGDPSKRRRWIIAIPVICAAMAAGVLTYGDLLGQSLNDGAIGLALGALGAVAVRLIITFRTSLVLLGTLEAETLTDALTGLPNRRALIRALEDHTRHMGSRPVVLALYDLDGFKRYNDAFGHQAGDALLARLGDALSEAIGGWGTGYRMGGDEFCVLLFGDLPAAAPVLETIADALSEHGEGFSVTSSWGAVSLPAEADSCAGALRIADQRMYAQKNGGRPSASRQSTDVLLRALAERHPALDEHAYDVAALAELTAGRLGCTADDVEQIRLAAELHDVGKVAIPEAILNKPGPLDEREWEYIRRHTLIGERIIAAAPSLQRVARMVRSSHERHDGGGYPDGLRADSIPLGARVIAVCDAYDAMIAARPYSPAMGAPDAMAELWRCAGAQFDPAVVAAFADALSAIGSEAVSSAAVELDWITRT